MGRNGFGKSELRARLVTPLKRALQEDGRRQDWLARQIGATDAEVSRWVNGLHVPREETQRRIADALGRPVGELFPTESPPLTEAA